MERRARQGVTFDERCSPAVLTGSPALPRILARVAIPLTLALGGAVTVLAPAPGPARGQAARSAGAPVARDPDVPRGRSFYFTRAVYSDLGRRRFGSWSTDYPKADVQFLIGLRHLTIIDAYEREHPVRLDDPELRRHPVLYAVEVGYMALTDGEVEGLRGYLLAGGLLVVDDFWGSVEWRNFEREIRRVFPDRPIVDIPRDHPLLHAFYDIDEIRQVPNVYLGRRGGRTWERDGYEPALKGIFDDAERLMVAINWNTDLGDAWEWAEDPFYPLPLANFAYQLGVNLIVYGMSH